MSGIAGIYHCDGRLVERASLARMLECVPHRGSDAIEIWTNGSVGFGHRQFCTTKESLKEVQPASNKTGICWVTFDGRIDNRDEITDRLRLKMGRIQGLSDVDLLLAAYDVWGENCLEFVIGDFAFGLWDSQKRQLFCGRDSYGIRSLYYHSSPGMFAFSSEVLQLFQLPGISVCIDEDKLAEWFTLCGLTWRNYRDLTRTYFRSISELPAGHFLVAGPAGVRVTQYWDAAPKREIRYQRDEEYYEHFFGLFREAVRCRLRSHGFVGAELSGGFDSSSVVCMAQDIIAANEATCSKFSTYSLVFDELTCDERPLIRTVTDKYPVEHHSVVSDALCGLQNFPPGSYPVMQIDFPDQFHLQRAFDDLYRLAHSQQVRVMLSGEGAEHHVMGSKLVLDSLLSKTEWCELAQRLRTIAGQNSFRSALYEFVKYGLVPLLPKRLSDHYYDRWIRADLRSPPIPAWCMPAFREKISLEVRNQKERLKSFPTLTGWHRQVEYELLDISHPLLLKQFAVPIERRFPYHDRRLVEFCLAIPPEKKYQHLRETRKRNIRGRALQRQSLRGLLPEEIRQSQSKVLFGDIYSRRFVHLKDVYLNVFAPSSMPSLAKLGLIDIDKFWTALNETFALFEAAPQSVGYYPRVWIDRTAQVEIWLRGIENATRNGITLAVAPA